jgi:hypothetical protein
LAYWPPVRPEPSITVASTVADVLDDHVVFEIECIDRMYLNVFSRILVFEPDVSAARQPAREYGATIAQDASNLADALNRIRMRDPDSWELLTQELVRCLPGLQSVQLVPVGGAAKAVSVQFRERSQVPCRPPTGVRGSCGSRASSAACRHDEQLPPEQEGSGARVRRERERFAAAFDRALTPISQSISSGESRAAFLSGSFGPGKSHFMAHRWWPVIRPHPWYA